jgi:hypothetical protein
MLTSPTAPELLESRIAPASIALGTGSTASGSVAFAAEDTLSATLHDPAGSGQLVVTGTVEISDAALALTISLPPTDLDAFIVIDNDDTDPITGTFAGLPEGAVFQVDGTFAKISYTGGDGNDMVVTTLVPRVKITADGRTATFTDVDGDLVTAKTTAGTWTRDMFHLAPRGDFINGVQVDEIALGKGFDGAKITISAKRDLFGGNGFVNITKFSSGSSAITSLDIDGDIDQLDLSLAGSTPIKSVTVHSVGQLHPDRPPGTFKAQVDFGRPVNKFIIEGDAVTAQITAQQTIKRVEIGGSFLGDSVLSAGQLDALVVAHDIVGVPGEYVLIYAYGSATSPTSGIDTAIGSITVGGRVERAAIQAGASGGMFVGLNNADASIGKISIGGDFIQSIITAGTTVGNDGTYGSADDAVYSGAFARNSPALIAQIGSIIIKGQVLGTGTGFDSYGISAEMIKKATIGPVKLPLSPGARNSDDFFFLAPTGPGPTGLQSDVVLLEVLA